MNGLRRAGRSTFEWAVGLVVGGLLLVVAVCAVLIVAGALGDAIRPT